MPASSSPAPDASPPTSRSRAATSGSSRSSVTSTPKPVVGAALVLGDELEGGQRARDAIEQARAALLLLLLLLPAPALRRPAARPAPRKDVGMATHEPCPRGRPRHRRGRTVLFARDRGVEEHLAQDVTELLFEMFRLLGLWRLSELLDRVDRLVGLLEQVARQRAVRLLGVPRAALAQRAHDCRRAPIRTRPAPRGGEYRAR